MNFSGAVQACQIYKHVTMERGSNFKGRFLHSYNILHNIKYVNLVYSCVGNLHAVGSR